MRSTKDRTLAAWVTLLPGLSSAAGLRHRPCMKGAVTKETSDPWRHFLFSSEQKTRLPA